MDLVKYLKRIKEVPAHDRVPSVSDIELDRLIRAADENRTNVCAWCPVCGHSVRAIQNGEGYCPNCGTEFLYI